MHGDIGEDKMPDTRQLCRRKGFRWLESAPEPLPADKEPKLRKQMEKKLAAFRKTAGH